jgi:hypothetical protein
MLASVEEKRVDTTVAISSELPSRCVYVSPHRFLPLLLHDVHPLRQVHRSVAIMLASVEESRGCKNQPLIMQQQGSEAMQ